jgi:glycine betaine/proline transport system ATP-binding protein
VSEGASPGHLAVRDLVKVFGPRPRQALELLRAGKSKAEVLAESDHVVGVRDATFAVAEGEIFVVMGLSGSGKSTLVRMLNRLIEPTAGQILLDGEDVVGMSRERLVRLRRAQMSMVFQSFALLPHKSVLDNVAFGLDVAQGRRRAHRDRARKALELMGIAEVAERRPGELSGGMQQRVGLARAWVTESDILLMDEAFSALDPLIRRDMQDALVALQERERRTIVFISHDLAEAVRIADRIAVMAEGRIVQVGTPLDIVNDPANDYVRAFFADVVPGQLFSAGDIARADAVPVLAPDLAADEAQRRLDAAGCGAGVVVDGEGAVAGLVTRASLASADGDLRAALVDAPTPVAADTLLEEVIPVSAATDLPVPVYTDARAYHGVITRVALLRALAKTRQD